MESRIEGEHERTPAAWTIRRLDRLYQRYNKLAPLAILA